MHNCLTEQGDRTARALVELAKPGAFSHLPALDILEAGIDALNARVPVLVGVDNLRTDRDDGAYPCHMWYFCECCSIVGRERLRSADTAKSAAVGCGTIEDGNRVGAQARYTG